MKLTDLEGQFIRLEYIDDPDFKPEGKRQSYAHVDTIAEAQGLMFVCPGCLKRMAAHNGVAPSDPAARPSVHSVIIWSKSRGIPDGVSPGPGRWTFHGTGLSDLTVHGDPVGSARSIQLGCWHGFIDNGDCHE